MRKYNKGSEWRKWDLHLHAPSTVFNNQFKIKGKGKDKWEKYVEEIESLEDISVLGITDYFSIDGYRKMLEFKNQGRIKNIDLLLPNIELRILPVTEKNKAINLHIIFSPSIVDELDSMFFGNLEFKYKNNTYKCTKQDLIRLGKAYDETLLDNNEAYKEGCNQFKTTQENLQKLFKKNKKLKDNIITAVSNNRKDGNSGIKHSSLAATRQEIYRFSDFIFSGNPSDIKYFLGKGKDNINKIVKDYGSIKACMHGSDAHEFSSICKPDKNRFTWIKADPTFEGLKQVLIEPEERVFIGEEPEIFGRIKENSTKYIKSLNIVQTEEYKGKKNINGEWFNDININLNSELVAIIGNKGSGKSALSDIISLCGNSKEHKNFSFLNNEKFKKDSLAKNFEATLIWENNIPNIVNLENIPNDILKVKYLPQGEFEKLTNEIKDTDKFQKEIENVIFSHIKEEDKGKFNDFSSLIEDRKEISEKEIKILKNKIIEINKKIIKLEEKTKIEYKKNIEQRKIEKENELNSLIEPQEVKKSDKNNDINQKIEELRKNLIEKEKILNTKKKERQKYKFKVDKLNKLIQIINIKINDINDFKEKELKFLENEYKINIDKILSINFKESKIEDLINDNQKKINDNDTDKIKKEVDDIQREIEKEENKLDSKNKKYQKYLTEKIKWKKSKKKIELEIDKYKSDLQYIDNKLNNEISDKRDERLEIVKKILENKNTIRSIYDNVKAEIDKKIKDNEELLKDYRINIEASLILENDFKDIFLNHILKNKSGSFYQDKGKETIDNLIKDTNFNLEDDILFFLKNIISNLSNDKYKTSEKSKRFIHNQIKDIESFYNYLFSLDYIKFNYQLKQDDKPIEQLSPGERGALLLIFYLVLDKDTKPLILDQPEDNLDNYTVANILVPFIRKAKKSRQIILVTHNPNLAVVADAEQIIWVEIDKKKNNKFNFISGSIENKEINKKLVEVLEGAMPAFNKRKRKYYE